MIPKPKSKKKFEILFNNTKELPCYAAEISSGRLGTTGLFKCVFMQTFSAMDMTWIALGIGRVFIVSTLV